jgi:hypothetical protein
MTGRTLAGILLTASLAVSAGGCSSSSDSTETPDAGPTGTLSIVSVNFVTTWTDGLCIEIPDGDDPTFPIVVSTAVHLRPPGYCTALQDVQCGHLLVRVNGRENSQSATTVALVHLGNLGNHYADLTITIELVDDDGKPIPTSADAGPQMPVMQTVKVTTSKSCAADGGASDAGAEGG